MFLSPVDELEIIRTVQQFKNKVSTDFTDINMSMVKTIITEIVKSLNHICDVSFQTGVFPNQMKSAKVIPVLEAGDMCVFINYRYISLLPQFSNILEKLYNVLNRYDLLCPSQYGFISNMSTSRAILVLVEEITNCLDNNKYYIGIFIDLKKAWCPWYSTQVDCELFRK